MRLATYDWAHLTDLVRSNRTLNFSPSNQNDWLELQVLRDVDDRSAMTGKTCVRHEVLYDVPPESKSSQLPFKLCSFTAKIASGT